METRRQPDQPRATDPWPLQFEFKLFSFEKGPCRQPNKTDNSKVIRVNGSVFQLGPTLTVNGLRHEYTFVMSNRNF